MEPAFSDSIFALATPPGQSALAVIRISGQRAFDVPGLFHCEVGAPKQATRMFLKAEDGSIIDDVITLAFAGPQSATGEDILEIYCHGSMAVIQDILDRLASVKGFRPALAGEFTRRAIDNNKMDITAAEGLADLIEAETSLQRRQAAAQMAGQITKPVSFWRQQITQLLAHLEAVIDFADEELPEQLIAEMAQTRSQLCQTLQATLMDNHAGEIIRKGLSVVLIGPVNAGKSTTLNALARREAAIVSEQAGTTRDLIEVRLNLNGIAIVLSDTAGWRDTDDLIEAEGIRRARLRAESADLVLFVVDGNQPEWAQQLKDIKHSIKCREFLTIISNADKGLAGAPRHQQDGQQDREKTLHLDLTNPLSAQSIENALYHYLIPLNLSAHTPIITRTRHRHALQSALDHLQNSQNYQWAEDIELIAEDFRAAATALGRITGHIDVEDLLDHIFSRFCIGK